jgi:hypothetical protein
MLRPLRPATNLDKLSECQVVGQPIVTRWLVSPLIYQDFRDGSLLLARGHHASATQNHQKRHADWLYTPQDENGKIEPPILPVAGRCATRMGRESACRYGLPGPIFLQAAEGQGAVVCLDWYSGFLFSWEVDKSHLVCLFETMMSRSKTPPSYPQPWSTTILKTFFSSLETILKA